MAFDYKAVAAGIARSEGMGALLPVVEKELLHYRILSAMQDGGFFGPIVFQGGTSLRLCHGSPRYSEDLDFAGGTGFGVDDLRGLGVLLQCLFDRFGSVFPQCGLMVFPGVVIVSR
ncbi:MAG: nucleotidyl transferase AbiEii/AbiGii toxin family protein [Bifidobacterium longum]